MRSILGASEAALEDVDLQNLTLAGAAAEVDRINARFYGRFPYPWPPEQFERVSDPRFESTVLNQALGDWRHGRVPHDGRIWVAGCGTNQAVITALRFPAASVVGSDLSAQSLAIAGQTAERLGLANLELRQESLNQVAYREEFDYVLATGVIHHNADPAATLARIAAALRPAGVLELMVYNRYHWLLPASFEKAVQGLAGDAGPEAFEEQLAIARALVDRFPARGLMGSFLSRLRGAPESMLADVLLQPVAHSYSPRSLAELCARCDLELLQPAVNGFDVAAGRHLWEVDLGDREVQQRYERLPDLERWQVASELLLEGSPMLWFYVARRASGHPRLSEREVSAAFLDTCFEPHRATKQVCRRTGAGSLETVAERESHPGEPRDARARSIVAAADGRTPMGEILRRLGVETTPALVSRLRLELTTPAFPYLKSVAERKAGAMEQAGTAKGVKGFVRGQRQAVTLASREAVKLSLLSPGSALPLVVEPAGDGVDVAEWAAGHRRLIEEKLAEHGALLFRGFGVETPAVFQRLAGQVTDDLFEDNAEHPRDAIEHGVYTPVFYPPDQMLLWHNENSFNLEWPSKILFCCVRPADEGGETPLADSCKVYEDVPPEIRARFVAKGVMYVRKYGAGLGLDWQTVFQTDDRCAVEEICRREGTQFEWKQGDRLRTAVVRPATVRHRATGLEAWFNQAQHWHPSCLDPATREAMAKQFADEDLPRHCYYGDGSPIADQEMAAILEVYRRHEVAFPWQAGDVVLVDNVRCAHARRPFTGPRKLLVALGDRASFAGAQEGS